MLAVYEPNKFQNIIKTMFYLKKLNKNLKLLFMGMGINLKKIIKTEINKYGLNDIVFKKVYQILKNMFYLSFDSCSIF